MVFKIKEQNASTAAFLSAARGSYKSAARLCVGFDTTSIWVLAVSSKTVFLVHSSRIPEQELPVHAGTKDHNWVCDPTVTWCLLCFRSVCLTKEYFHLICPYKTYLWHFGAIEDMAKQPLDISETQALCQDEIFKSTFLTLCDICFYTSWYLARLVPAARCFQPLLQPFLRDQTCWFRKWEGRSFQLSWEKFRTIY